MIRQYSMRFFPLWLLFCTSLMSTMVLAQTGNVLQGTVTDAATGQAIPFATVILKKSLVGTTTNDDGQFDLHVPDSLQEDELLVSFLGYGFKTFPLQSVKSPLLVSLVPSSIDLKEVLIRPLPPTYYIKLAMQSKADNYPSEPFESNAYYREIVKENGNFLRSHEGVFKTYYPDFQDTLKNQHQLLLFRKATDLQELAFMKKERMKDDAREKRREEKAVKKGKPVAKNDKKEDKDSLKIGEMFGGPENLLKLSDIFKDPDNFLDSNEFKNYSYSFAKSSSYNNAALMVIQYKSKGKVDHVRESGYIYLDIATNAIVQIESQGSYAIPTLVRPVLFVMGIGVKNPTFKSSTRFQKVQDRWYPNAIQFTMNIQVEKKRLFTKNDNSSFDIEGVLVVNKLKTTSPLPVEAAKRYSVKKKPEEQVFNDQGLDWSEINVIR